MPQASKRTTPPKELTLESNLEEGMHWVAYYPSEDDALALLRRLRAELEAFLPSEHYELDYATSASTAIYVTVIIKSAEVNLKDFVKALETITDSTPPEVILIRGPVTDHQNVFGPDIAPENVYEIREEGEFAHRTMGSCPACWPSNFGKIARIGSSYA
jgi:hypothetical protein